MVRRSLGPQPGGGHPDAGFLRCPEHGRDRDALVPEQAAGIGLEPPGMTFPALRGALR